MGTWTDIPGIGCDVRMMCFLLQPGWEFWITIQYGKRGRKGNGFRGTGIYGLVFEEVLFSKEIEDVLWI